MTPTPKLRWVERNMDIPHPQIPYVVDVRKVRFLQQWWEASPHTAVGTEPFHGRGEWRDVPVEEEK